MVGIQEKGSAEQPTATMNTECSSPAPAHAACFQRQCATCAEARRGARTAELRVVGVRFGPDHPPVAVLLRTPHRPLLSEIPSRARMRLCGVSRTCPFQAQSPMKSRVTAMASLPE